MNILIPDDYQHAVAGLNCLGLLEGHRVRILGDLARDPSADEEIAAAEAIVPIRERTRIDADFLRRAPRLKCISQTGKIAPHIDVAACTERGVAVLEGSGSPTAPAELTWALILAAKRQIVTAANDLRHGRWQTTFGESVHGQTLGIWGYGKIGRMIAQFGRVFGMEVMIWGRDESRALATRDGFATFSSRDALFESSDVLTIHLRLVAETAGAISAADFARMKKSALFVNTSRAGLIARGALEAALAAGRPGGAALDVFDDEPLYDPHHPLLSLPNVLCTPHIGYVERGSYELYFSKAFVNILAFAAGHPANLVNPAVLEVR
ncbi:D-2-hydroxyacid dehydrogenase family protein [Telmatospirillum sp.]|uniref:D-2-hydroxyacid dehydrogenase family protein n=1 Tax=Telmatospirillum sp. TaxID=2079197 RepID=UPI002843D0D9|nr:D-2-hydroxyacid dehydrogenase family protein [Telmatospirillum sp.]MDR3437195.1 D-2-hydroxyacid dehydrogenase family protein [Telmatospirillum sp.]